MTWGVAAAVAILALGVLQPVPAVDARAGRETATGGTTFQRIDGATSVGAWSAYGNVVAGGDGTYHAVSKIRTVGDAVAYLRSADGGRTWHRAAVFGSAGGGTRPWVAAEGDTVAIGYIGAEAVGSETVGVPYLVTSTDGGVSWGAPRRIAPRSISGNIQVAVDDDRVWVAWDEEVAGTTDGGSTWFAQISNLGFPYLAAGGGKAVIASTRWDGGAPEVRAAVVDGESALAGTDFVPLDGPAQTVAAVAAADGRAFVLANRSTGPVLFGTHGTDQLVATAVPVTGASQLAAGRGFVAVAGADAQGAVRVALSYDGGASFAAPVVAARTAVPGSQLTYSLAAAVTGDDQASPRFEWSVPDRYVDDDGDGLPDPLNDTGDPSLDALRVFAARTTHVALDSCGSKAAGDRPIVNRSWFRDGQPIADAQDLVACAGPTIDVESGDSVAIRLEIEDDEGHRSSVTQTVAPRDVVVASLGDSVASGEGSPNQPQPATTPERWTDQACHASAWAGPALAAKELEAADPHSSVTFLQLACSGAAVVDTYDDPAQTSGPGDDPKTGGLLDAYQGVDAQSRLRPSQVSQLDALVGNRSVDAVTVSIGANDARFSELLKSCLVSTTTCSSGTAATAFDTRIADLPRRYDLLAIAFDQLGIDPAAVRLTTYFDPTTDQYGVPNLRCALSPSADGYDPANLISDTEARWAHTHVIGSLDGAVAQAATAHGWTLIGGMDAAFDRHGYCSDDPWVVRISESLDAQGDEFGAFHPNRRGQQVYGDALGASLRPLVDRIDAAHPPTGGPADAGALGDISLLVGDGTRVRSVALSATGGQPTVGLTRTLDQVASGTGFVNPYEPALDASSSVAMLVEGSAGSGLVPENVLVPTGLHPNAQIADVRFVQAPDDGHVLVTGRATVVEAVIDATIAAPTTITASVDVTGSTGSGALHPIVSSDPQEITLKPGRNRVLLPTDETFEVGEGEAVWARVRITDPAGATPGSDGDNEYTTAETDPHDAIATRPLRIAFAPLDTGSTTPSCNLVDSVLEQQADYARQALPVPDDGIDVYLSCTPIAAVDQDAEGVYDLLDGADTTARHAAMDFVVAVAPDGWIAGAVDDGSGARAVGANVNRGIAIDAHADLSTLAHEIGHGLGLGHTDGEVAASGARVDVRSLREGIDWMVAASPDTHRWTGGETWDALAPAIGGPDRAPEPMFPTPYGYWVTGVVPPGQPPEIEPLLPDRDDPLDPVSAPGDDTSSFAARPLDANGNPVGGDLPIGLSGAHTAGADIDLGRSFAQRIVVPAGTAKISFVLDGVVVETRTIGAAPTVAITSPGAGDQLARGEPLTVSWTVTDPDSTDHTVTLLASDDDGATWRPLADHLTGTSTTITVPRDLAGDHVRVRVIASDGTRDGSADSGTFSVERAGAIEDRLAFLSSGSTLQMGTSALDGTGTRWFSQLPAPFGLDAGQLYQWSPDRVIDWQGFRVGGTTWNPDSTRLYFSANWNAALDDVDPTGGGNALGCQAGAQRLYSVAPDGSDLRVEAGPSPALPCGTTLGQPARLGNFNPIAVWSCLSFSADGDHLLWSDVVMDRVGGTWTNARQVPGLYDRERTTHYPASIGVPAGGYVYAQSYGCPTLSPDGTKVATATDLDVYSASDTGVDGAASDGYATFDVDGDGTARIVARGEAFSSSNGDLLGPAWSPSGEIVSGAQLRTCQATDWWTQHALGGCSQDVLAIDPATGTTRRLLTPVSPYATEAPAAFDASGASNWGDSIQSSVRTSPSGRLYASTRHPRGAADLLGTDAHSYCGWWFQDHDAATFVLPTAYGGATNTAFDDGECRGDVDWGRPETSGTPAGQEPIVPDLTNAPPDTGNEPVPPVDADTESPTAPGDPAPGAGPVEAGPAPRALDADVTLDGDGRAAVVLANDQAAPVRYAIDVAAAAPLTFPGTVADPDGGAVTPLGGSLSIEAAAEFDEPIAVPVRVLGTDHTATLTVHPPVVPDVAAPVAQPDALTVDVGTEAVMEGIDLLRNDQPGGARNSLLVHAAYDYGAGEVELDRDGRVHVKAAHAGTATFTYLVLEQETGQVAEGTVTVTAVGEPTTTTTTSTSTSTSTSTTVPVTSTTSTTSTSTTVPVTSTTSTSTTVPAASTTSTSTTVPVTPPSTTSTAATGGVSASGDGSPAGPSASGGGVEPSTGALARTGSSDLVPLAELGAVVVALGAVVVGVARRRRRLV